eukprot:5819077-Alexandrium_andersonii.AAC.1
MDDLMIESAGPCPPMLHEALESGCHKQRQRQKTQYQKLDPACFRSVVCSGALNLKARARPIQIWATCDVR